MNAVEPNEKDRPPEISPWLASLMLRRGGGTLTRFALFYQRLAALPRPWKTRLRRKLALGLTSAALLLALAGPTAFLGASPDSPAAVITVADGEVEIAANDKCSLIEAIVNAQATKSGQLHADCAAGNLSGRDTIQLPLNGKFALTQAYDDQYNGLPPITSKVTIEGNGAAIVGGWGFGILRVTLSGDLSLTNLDISGGYRVYDWGAGGIHNDGKLIVENSRVFYNNSRVGPVGAIWNSGSMSIKSSLIADSWGDGSSLAGGIANQGSMIVRDSSIIDNVGCYYGAAIDNSGEAVVTNSTISGNVGYNCFEGFTVVEGSIRNSGRLTLNNTTVTGDGYASYSGIWNTGTLELYRNIISGNASDCYSQGQYGYWYDCERNVINKGVVIADNYNIFGQGGEAGLEGLSAGPRDVVPVETMDQILSAADWNSSLLPTHALPAGSPAIDLAPGVNCAPGTTVDGLDQRGQPRSVDADGILSRWECDAGALEMQPTELKSAILLTTTAAGRTTDGLVFTKTDILKWNGASWSRFFDGRARGLPAAADIASISVPAVLKPDVYLTFVANTRVPGVGVVTPHDIVRWDGARFSLLFDGSDVGLTGAGERIDGLEVLPPWPVYAYGNCKAILLISLTDGGLVEYPWYPARLQGEDVLEFCAEKTGDTTSGYWGLLVDGSEYGMPKNSTIGLASDRYNLSGGGLYLTTKGPFHVGDASGTHSMIYKFQDSWFSGPYFKAADHGLLQKVDGLEVLGDIP